MRLTLRGRGNLIFNVAIPLAASVCACAAAYFAIASIPSLNALERTQEAGQSYSRSYAPVDPNIVFIEITKETIPHLGLNPGLDRIPRKFHARLLQGLDAAGARCALIDLRFFQSMPGDDSQLTNTLKTLKSLKVTLITEHDDSLPAASTDEGYTGALRDLSVWPYGTNDHVAIGSVDALVLEHTDTYIGGYAVQDDKKRHIQVFHAAISAALQYSGLIGEPSHFDSKKHTLAVGPVEWPLDDNQALLVHWTSTANPFPHIEYADALRRLANPADSQFFHGKLLVVGDVRGSDIAQTQPFGQIPGTLFVAQMVNTALLPYGSQLRGVNEQVWSIWVVLLGFMAFIAGTTQRIHWILLGIGSCLAACLAAPWLVVSTAGLTVPVYQPCIAIALSGVLGMLFVNTPLVRSDYRLAGETEEATVLFLDLQGSTELVRRLGPQDYSHLMSDLQLQAQSELRRLGGDVERTLGDGLIALFRGSKPRHHALRAVAAIAPLAEAVQRVSNKHGLELSITVGLETGIVSGSYVPEGRGFRWSSSGSTVNLAQRLQASCSDLNTSVTIGPVAARLVEHEYKTHSLGSISPKGFPEPIEVFKLDE